MNHPARVLICDDDPIFHLTLKQSLKSRFECRSAYNADEAEAILKNHRMDIILLDVQMRTGDEGLQAIARLQTIDPEATIVMSSGLTDFETVRKAMVLGASDYVVKDSDPDTLTHSLQRVLEKRRLIHRKEQQNFEVVSQQQRHVLIGNTERIMALRRMIEKMRAQLRKCCHFRRNRGGQGSGRAAVAPSARRWIDGTIFSGRFLDDSKLNSRKPAFWA